MKKVVLGAALSFVISLSVSAEDAISSNGDQVNCSNFSEVLTAAQNDNLMEAVNTLASNCPDFSDQIVETAISLTPTEQHQEIMQTVADTGLMLPSDILLAAIAGGGDVATLSEPTAGGNLAIVPPSSATAPPIIGGRNGGAVASDN
jgi:hypothetical protein